MPDTTGTFVLPYPNTSAAPDVPGDILTLAQATTDEFDRRATTFRFADSTARAAETLMREGDRAYQLDTNIEYFYDGSSWTALDSGWTTLTLAGGATAASGDAPAVRKLNGIVYFRGTFANTGTGASVKTTLPAGMWPSSEVTLLVRQGTSSTRLSINTSGQLSTLNSVTDVYLTGVNPYPAA